MCRAITIQIMLAGLGIVTAKLVLNAMEMEHHIVQNGGFLLHASYIGWQGRAILFTAPWNKQDIAKIYEIAQQLEVQVKASAYMYPPIRLDGQPGATKNRLTPEEAAQCMVQWDLLPQADSAEDILQKVLAEYEVDEATVKADIAEFLQKLRDLEIL